MSFKYLVIIESPGKTSKIQEYLGPQYKVTPCFGHCVDLPRKKFGIDIKKDFEPSFEVIPEKKDVLENIKKLAKSAEIVYIFTDLDREGASLGNRIAIELPQGKTVKRLKTNSITKSAIQEALKNPSEMEDEALLIESQLARRILDRLVGFRTSFLTQMATGGKSAGRVQSAMLRIIVEREQEIQNFVPEEYWILSANLHTAKNKKYAGVLSDKIKVANETEANNIYTKVVKGSPVVTLVESKDVSSNPWAPFTTMSLIASASTILGWTAKKTMATAQVLYESSLLTYMRTDSVYIEPNTVNSIRKYAESNYGVNYLPSSPNFYKSGSSAQEGHEACRPTDVTNVNPSLPDDQKKLYRLVWKRTVASQMKPGIDKKTKVVTQIANYDFVSNGSVMLFDGYRKVWDYSLQDNTTLPELKVGEKTFLDDVQKDQKFTSPPNRYSDASLSKTAEKLQIARPSTFARSIETLVDRNYIKQVKKSFEPTEMGCKVVDFLKSANMCFIDLKFTADLEDELDQIAEGKMTRLELLTKFWERLKKDIESGQKIKQQSQVTEYFCPLCKAPLLLKHSAYGAFFSCSNYKKSGEGCKFIGTVGDHGEPIEKKKKEIVYSPVVCNLCGNKMIVRTNKKTGEQFLGCSKYPACRAVADLDGVFKEIKPKKQWKKWNKKKKSDE